MKKERNSTDPISRLRGCGLRATASRVRIIAVLVRAKNPLSADDIYKKVVGDMNRTTVYRTLSALERADCVSRFTFQNKHVYELSTSHSHYLVCKACERVERIPTCTIGDIEKASLRSSKKFSSVDHHTLQLSGVCMGCA